MFQTLKERLWHFTFLLIGAHRARILLLAWYQFMKNLNNSMQISKSSSYLQMKIKSRLRTISKRWLAVPYADRKAKKFLNDWFKVEGIPTLIILDGQGKTIRNDATELVFKYGANAYPFTEEKLEQLRQEEEAKREAQTLESLLVTEERDYLLSRFEPVSEMSICVY